MNVFDSAKMSDIYCHGCGDIFPENDLITVHEQDVCPNCKSEEWESVCKGKNCDAVRGVGHSADCLKEHEEHYDLINGKA